VELKDAALATELLDRAVLLMPDPITERRLKHLYRIQRRRFEDAA
jgi:hypothetical protein